MTAQIALKAGERAANSAADGQVSARMVPSVTILAPDATPGRQDAASGGAMAAARKGSATGEDASLKRQALMAFAIRVASAGLAYVSQVYFARVLGVDGYGIFSVGWTLVLVLGHVAPLGVAESAVRFLPRYHLRGQQALARGFIAMGREVSLIGGAAFAGIGAIVLLLVPTGDICWPILGPLACIMPFAYQDWLEGVARGLDRPGLALACPYLLRPVLVGLALAAAAFLGHPTAASAMLAAFLATLVTATIQSVLVRRAVRQEIGEGPRRNASRAWLRASAPLAGGIACDQVSAYADVLALGLLASPAEAAIYIAASKTLTLANFAQYALGVVAGRRFAAAKARGGGGALTQLAAASTRLTLVASLAAIGFVLVAGVPLLALFGKDFGGAYPVLAALCVGVLARAACGQKEAILTMLGYQKGLFLISFATLVVALIADFGLTFLYGVMGAAAACAIVATFRSAAVILLARRALAPAGRTAP